MNKFIFLFIVGGMFSCGGGKGNEVHFDVVDTDFSKGRLGFQQTIILDDLVKFHGHLCDGLVVGAMAIGLVFDEMYPDQPIDRTNIRVVSAPSPCLTDVGVYLSGGRYQYNSFYVADLKEIYIVQRIDTKAAYSVSMKPGVKPKAIDSLGAIAIKQQLPACDIDVLKKLEDDFTEFLLNNNPRDLFEVKELKEFKWNPEMRNDFLKTDVLNKQVEKC